MTEENTDQTEQTNEVKSSKEIENSEEVKLCKEIVEKLGEYDEKISEAHSLSDRLRLKTLAAHLINNHNFTLELVICSLIAKAKELSQENKQQSVDYLASVAQGILNNTSDDFPRKKDIQNAINKLSQAGQEKQKEQNAKSQEEIIQELKEQIELMRVMEHKKRFEEKKGILTQAFELFAQISDKTTKARMKDLLEDARDDLLYAWAVDELMKLERDLFNSRKIKKKLNSTELLANFFDSEEFNGEIEYMKKIFTELDPLVDKDKKNPDYLISESEKRRELHRKMGAAVVNIFRRLSEMLFEKTADIASKGNRSDALTVLRTIEEIVPGYVEHFEMFDSEGIKKLVEEISQKIEEERKKINGRGSERGESKGGVSFSEDANTKQELDGLDVLFIQPENVERALNKMEAEGYDSWELFNNFEASVKDEVDTAQQKVLDYVRVSNADEGERRKKKIIGRIETVQNIVEKKIEEFGAAARPFNAAYSNGFFWTESSKNRLPAIPTDAAKMKSSKSIIFHFKLLKILEEMEKAVKKV